MLEEIKKKSNDLEENCNSYEAALKGLETVDATMKKVEGQQ